MKQVLFWTAVVFGTFTSSISLGYSGGTGTAEDPYQISNSQDLCTMGVLTSDYAKYFILTKDIDLNGQSYFQAVIAWGDIAFTGTFDGNGHKITNFTILAGGRLGLFGTIGSGGEVKNLGIENITIRHSRGSHGGGLAGFNQGSIRNCYTQGIVSGAENTGGLAGCNSYGTISNCYSTCSVTGTQYVGGLVGINSFGHINNCYSAGTVIGSYSVGGLAGNNTSGRIINSYSTSSTSGTNSVGGLAGQNITPEADISNCYSAGLVKGTGSVGGLVGVNLGTVSHSFWDMQTSGQLVSSGGTGKTTHEMQLVSTFTNSSLVSGKTGSALRLDGIDDYVEVPGYFGIGRSNPRTVSLWVKTTAVGASNIILVQWGTDEVGRLWSVYLGDGRMPAVSISRYGVYGRRKVSDGQWHHIAAVLEKTVQSDYSQIKLYIDGVLDSQTGNLLVNTAQTTPLRMGTLEGRSSGAECLLDEVCIYNRALSAEELDSAYATGLAEHWMLDESSGTTAYNSVGTQNGVLHNMGSSNWVAGKTGNALQFDGIDDYVDVPGYKGIPGGSSRACSAWIKTTSALRTIILSWGADLPAQKWLFRTESNGALGVGIFGGNYISTNTMTTINDGQWHHVAAMLNDDGSPDISEVLFTIDGIVQSTAASTTQAVNTAAFQDVMIGAYKNADVVVEYFKGLIDDVRIYNQVPVTPHGPVPTEGLAALWSMEEIENNTLYDSVGSYHGILKNATDGPLWDFIHETACGTCDYWSMPDSGYPVLSALSGHIPPQPAGGGTETDPYRITNAGELGTVWYDPTAHYLLANDIDLAGIQWGMSVVPQFGGVLNGNGFRIKNLSINGGNYLGLIGQIATGGQVYDLGIENCAVSSAANSQSIGGLAGCNVNGAVNRCFTTGSVKGGTNSQYIGGLTGYNNGDIRECYSKSSVSGAANTKEIGGLAGRNNKNIVDCYSTGPVSGSTYLGGLVGRTLNGQVVQSFWDVYTSKQGSSSGGIPKSTADMKKRATFAGNNWLDGKTGNALKLYGAKEYVEIPGYKGVVGTQSRTCSAWIRSPSTQRGNIISWGADQPGQKWLFRAEADGKLGVGILGGNYIVSTTAAILNDIQWHHIAAVLNDDGSPSINEIQLYIDGVLQSTYASSTQAVNTIASQDVMLGAYQEAGAIVGHFNGRMDDVCIYNRALSASEIDPAAPISTEGLIAHWTMDETGGTFVHDSGAVYHGQLKNSDNPGWNFVSSTASPMGTYVVYPAGSGNPEIYLGRSGACRQRGSGYRRRVRAEWICPGAIKRYGFIRC